jgi:RNA polymerase sigma-70 factor (ECF subfamily)
VTAATPQPRPNPESDETPEPPVASERAGQPAGSASAGGDVSEASFVAVYTEHYETLCRFARRYVRSSPAAEELVHDVFLRLWMRRALSQSSGLTPDYLYAAVRNAAIDVLRRTRSEQRALDRASRGGANTASSPSCGDFGHEVALGGGETVEVLDLAASLQRAIDELPARPREVLLLKWRLGLSNGEVAARLGLALKTVEMHVTRALARLRDVLSLLTRENGER